jgi:hypothetical protein
MRREDQIAECLRHSDIVYNLVGRDYATKSVSLFLAGLSFLTVFSETSTSRPYTSTAPNALQESLLRPACPALCTSPISMPRIHRHLCSTRPRPLAKNVSRTSTRMPPSSGLVPCSATKTNSSTTWPVRRHSSLLHPFHIHIPSSLAYLVEVERRANQSPARPCTHPALSNHPPLIKRVC